MLERLVEAENVFTLDLSSAIDEFIGDSNIESDRITQIFSTMLRVYFETEEARQEFFNLIGYKNDEKQLTIRYPATFQKQAAAEWK